MDTNTTIPYGVTPDAALPKKYIRTLEGDMETLKKGGTPDLAPLKERPKPPKPTSAPVAPAAAPAAPSAEPVPVPPPKSAEHISNTPMPIPSSNIGHVSSRPLSIPISESELRNNSIPQPESPIEPSAQVPVPEPPASESPEPESSPLETYASDFTDKVKEENASPATVLAAEQDAQTGEIEVPQPPHSRSNLLYTIAGVVLLIIGGVGVYIAYTKHLASIAPVIFTSGVSTPIFVDEREEISGVGITLLEAIEQSTTRPLASGTVRLLYTSSATTTDNSVFSALRKPAPDILLRNVKADGSMAGVVNVNGVQSPFFILSVASYSNTFSGMLKWEPLMPRDLSELFPPFSAPSVSTTTSTVATTTPIVASTTQKVATTTPKTASTTISKNTPTIIAGFRDEVVSNHDVRVYRDSAGRTIFLYGYWNQTTLIIARSPSAFTEILNRLANSHS